MQHHLNGRGRMWDELRDRMLAYTMQLQVEQDATKARVVVGDDEGKEEVNIAFLRPEVVSAFSIIAQAMEDLGQARKAKPAGPPLPNWIVCPACNQEGGTRGNYETWFECWLCHGEGIYVLPEPEGPDE